MAFFDNLDQIPEDPQALGGPITYEDITNPDKNARNGRLFGQFGMDPNGDNEAGAILRRYLQAMFPVLAQRLAAMNMLNPAVMNSIKRLALALSPSGQESLAGEQAARLERVGAQKGERGAARLRDAGASDVVQEGARMASANQATEAANSYRNELFSPAMMAKNAAALTEIQGGLDDSVLGGILGAGQFVEGRSAANKADRARGGFMGQLGGLMGTLGQIYGATGGMGLFDMGGGGGGGNDPWYGNANFGDGQTIGQGGWINT